MRKKIVHYKTVLLPIRVKKEAPLPFNTIRAYDKWKTWKEQVGVWKCQSCGYILKDGPQRANPFHGCSVACNNCNAELTRRTGGGKLDPFGWVLVKSE